MTYTFKQNLVAKDKYSIKCPNPMTAEFIVVHNTANDAPAENEIKYMISSNTEVSVRTVKAIVRGFRLKSVTQNQAVPVLKMPKRMPQCLSLNY